MKMDDEQLKRLLQEAADYEADCIMAEVDSDPNLKDVIAPEVIHDKLFQQIHEHEKSETKPRREVTQEDEELICLGRHYQKKLGRRKYHWFLVAIICALGVGTVSIGDGKKVFSEMQRKLGDREQTVVNSGKDGDDFIEEIVTEEQAFQKIEDEFGVWAVRMSYLPEGMKFDESYIESDLQSASLHYIGQDNNRISYYLATKNRTGSVSTDVEDDLVREYEKEVNKVLATVQEYVVKENQTKRWRVLFVYNDTQYILTMTGVQEKEVEKIIENLYFS